jgi:hypothetical protein
MCPCMGAEYFMSDCNVMNLSWGGVVMIVSRLQDGWLRNCGSVDGRGNIFFYTPKASSLALGPTQTHIHWVSVALSPGLTQLGCEADPSPPSSAEVKNEWHCTCTSTYTILVCTGTTLHLLYPTVQFYIVCCDNFIVLYQYLATVFC